jgi:hypothetical protein
MESYFLISLDKSWQQDQISSTKSVPKPCRVRLVESNLRLGYYSIWQRELISQYIEERGSPKYTSYFQRCLFTCPLELPSDPVPRDQGD